MSGKEVDLSGLYAKVAGGDDRRFDAMAGHIASVISLVEGAGSDFDEAFPKGGTLSEKASLKRMRRIAEPVYRAYRKALSDADEIDFEDMLNLAAELVRQGRFANPWRYVVVDEYQDISRSRCNLLSALRGSSDFKLFCVGDDWQSIYRFNGSDVGFILDFERWWGPSETCLIETTYRFSGDILDESNRIMEGRPGQMPKTLKAGRRTGGTVDILDGDSRADCAAIVSETLSSLPAEDSVLMLGRHRHDLVTLEGGGFSWRPDLGSQSFTVTDRKNQGRRIKFMTVHGSKGMQADHVFILNCVRGPGGFPDRRPEPSAVRLMLDGSGSGSDEERRLFYVAMTRARKSVHVVTVRGMESEFVRELKAFEKVRGMTCPECGGRLVVREGPYGRFLGCTGYRSGCRYRRKLRRSHQIPPGDRHPMEHDPFPSLRCPVCGKPLDPSDMIYNEGTATAHLECYRCPCGCRPVFEASVEL